MNTIVCKFGGTSLATRAQIEKCLAIMKADQARKFMVVSAPGSRYKGDVKITDLLIKAAAEFPSNRKSASADQVLARFREIMPEDTDLLQELTENLHQRLADLSAANYEESLKAFGEYACARAVKSILTQQGTPATFMDPIDFKLRITGKDNNIQPDHTYFNLIGKELMSKAKDGMLIIPGFYGCDAQGNLQTLPRGGSDTTGAVIARAVGAKVYENWTDEDGLKRADPRIVPLAANIPEMTYDEARELAYMSFKLQDACFAPLKGAGIILRVRNTNNPAHPGTDIVDTREVDPEERIIGVAREDGFVSIGMRKLYIDKEVGFGRKMLSVPEELNLPYEHTPDGVDSTALVMAKKYMKQPDTLNLVIEKLKQVCNPDTMIIRDIALVSIAGQGMQNHYDVHARAFTALAEKKIAIRMIDDGADDLSCFIGVDQEHSAEAVAAIYDEFYPEK